MIHPLISGLNSVSESITFFSTSLKSNCEFKFSTVTKYTFFFHSLYRCPTKIVANWKCLESLGSGNYSLAEIVSAVMEEWWWHLRPAYFMLLFVWSPEQVDYFLPLSKDCFSPISHYILQSAIIILNLKSWITQMETGKLNMYWI